MSTDSRLVILFGLEECNTGTEMLEYIDSLAQENDADWLVVTLYNPLSWHLGGYMLLCSYIRIDSVWAVACCCAVARCPLLKNQTTLIYKSK